MLKSRWSLIFTGIALGSGAVLLVMLFLNDRGTAAIDAEAMIREQERAWNAGDLAGFMKHYDMNDNITFYSDDKVSQGWVTVNDKYTKKYGAGKAAMGQLSFSDLQFTTLSSDAVMARGRWTTTGTPNAGTGLFTILIRKTPQGWKIVHDHTSAKKE